MTSDHMLSLVVLGEGSKAGCRVPGAALDRCLRFRGAPAPRISLSVAAGRAVLDVGQGAMQLSERMENDRAQQEQQDGENRQVQQHGSCEGAYRAVGCHR